MLEIALHEDADEEFKAAITFYESSEPGLGQIFLERLSEGFEFIVANPLASQILFDDFRRHLIRQFPYSIVYRIEGDSILVLAVAHWSRRPGYWKQRTD
jgi:plasmid stabilization system protein ParE